jgi:hypothetical protein
LWIRNEFNPDPDQSFDPCTGRQELVTTFFSSEFYKENIKIMAHLKGQSHEEVGEITV